MYEATENDFEKFKREVSGWITVFGLYDWSIHIKMDAVEDVIAACFINRTGRIACIVLNKHQEEPLTHVQIEKSAFHEVLEILLADIEYLAMDNIPEEEKKMLLQVERHRIIRRMEAAKDWLKE